MKRPGSVIAQALPLLVLLLSGCGGGTAGSTPEADFDKPLEQVRTEASAADAGSLEATLSAYEPAVAAAKERLEAALEESKALEPGQLLSAAGDAITREVDQARSELTALEHRMTVYAQELAKRGE